MPLHVPPASVMLVLATFLALGGCSSLERSLIFPGATTQGRADTVVPPASGDYELLPLTTRSDTKIIAQFGRALDPAGTPRPDSATRPTVIYFYGNGACLAYSQQEFDAFRQLGFNVIIPDFPGYGMRGGIASERACYETADAVHPGPLTSERSGRPPCLPAGFEVNAGQHARRGGAPLRKADVRLCV